MTGTPTEHRSKFHRRDVLRVGGVMGMGLSLSDLLNHRASAASGQTFGKAKQVIMMFLHGGHPQQETFDPKPNGPVDVRGPYGAISTSVPGTQFCELLPALAKQADKLAIVRSMTHDNTNHVQACLPAQTGHKHGPNGKSGDFPPSETDFPPFGAVLDHLQGSQNSLPAWVRIGPLMRRGNGTTLHGQTPGFLGGGHSSFVVDQSLRKADVEIEALQNPGGLDGLRLTDRANLRKQFNSFTSDLEKQGEAQRLAPYFERAVSLLASQRTKAAFDLSKEPQVVREAYGKTEFGQRCLLARRLAEAGVPMVNISYCHTPSGSWDTHSENAKKMKESLGPTLDESAAALIHDLDQRGMLEDTLVVINAEFGRTPIINKNRGRDHWPYVYSLALAGAGVQGGAVFGKSDKSAAYPLEHPRDPADMAATIYHLLGVDPETRLYDGSQRPHSLVIGSPIHELLA